MIEGFAAAGSPEDAAGGSDHQLQATSPAQLTSTPASRCEQPPDVLQPHYTEILAGRAAAEYLWVDPNEPWTSPHTWSRDRLASAFTVLVLNSSSKQQRKWAQTASRRRPPDERTKLELSLKAAIKRAMADVAAEGQNASDAEMDSDVEDAAAAGVVVASQAEAADGMLDDSATEDMAPA